MIRDQFKNVEISLSELRALADEFLNKYSGGALQTQRAYKNALQEFLNYFSRQRTFRFQVNDLEKYKRRLLTVRKMKERSVVTYFSVLRSFLSFLVDIGMLEKNPARRIKVTLQDRKVNFSFLTAAEIKTLLDSFSVNSDLEARDYSILTMVLYCGLSEEESARLHFGDFVQSRRKWFVKVGKSGGEDMIELSGPALEAALQLFERRKNAAADAPFFISYSSRSKYKGISARGVREVIISRLRASGIEREGLRLSPYSLKRSAAVIMAAEGREPDYIKRRFGFKGNLVVRRCFERVDLFKRGY